MRPRQLLPLALIGRASCQSLSELLTAQSSILSSFNSWLTSEQLVFQVLNTTSGVTLLAPSNNAINQLYNTPLATQLATDPNFLAAFLSYHVLSGQYLVSDLLSTPAATMSTFLDQKAYTNVTGGQKVAARSNNGAITFISGNGAQSNVEAFVPLPTPSRPALG